jgi:hypothetical protein
MKHVLILGLVLMGWLPLIAAAHPADTLVQAAYITLAPQQVKLELDFTAGDLVAQGFLAQIDFDHDDIISQDEVNQFSKTVLEKVKLEINGKAVQFKLESSQIPEVKAVKLGGGQLQLNLTGTPDGLGLSNELVFNNRFQPVKSGYLANVFVQSADVKILSQQRNESQQEFRVGFEMASRALPSKGFSWWLVLSIPVLLGFFWLPRVTKPKVVGL